MISLKKLFDLKAKFGYGSLVSKSYDKNKVLWYSNSPEKNTKSKFGIYSVTEFDEKHSDSTKLKAYLYYLSFEYTNS